MLHSWSYYPSTLSCSLCLRLEKNKYTFGSVGVFPPTEPMHLIFALSLWAGYTSSKTWRSFPTPRLHQVKNLEHKHTGDTRHSGNHCPEMLEDVNYTNNNNYYYYNRPQQNQERRSRTPRHPDLHRHGELPRSTLWLWLRRQHYAQACRLDTKFPKGNIEDPLRPSWYLVCPSRLRGDRDWYWWEGTHHPRKAIPEHLGSYHLR